MRMAPQTGYLCDTEDWNSCSRSGKVRITRANTVPAAGCQSDYYVIILLIYYRFVDPDEYMLTRVNIQ